MVFFKELVNKKKVVDCLKRCFLSKEKVFFKAVLRYLFLLKLWLKNVVIFLLCCDLGIRVRILVVKSIFKYFEFFIEYVEVENKNFKYLFRKIILGMGMC